MATENKTDNSDKNSAPAGSHSRIGSTIDSKYTVLSVLGGGGMGVVYEAEHLLMKRRVALKVLLLKQQPGSGHEPDDVFVQRFYREARTASQIHHPNAITIYDFGLVDEMPYLVMEYIEGRSLKDIIDESGALPLDRIVLIFSQICGAVAAAHKLGIVHRDLKPDNIMVFEDDEGNEHVKVLDFGIAKVISNSESDAPNVTMTQAGMAVGTPRYMSPEQVLGKELDHRSDIYSLGVVLYELLSGEAPFDADSSMQIMLKHVNGRVESLVDLKPELKILPAVDKIVLRSLSKEPDDRFLLISDFSQALQEIVYGVSLRELEFTSTTRAVPTPGSPNQSRRNLGIIAAGVASLAVVALGAGYLMRPAGTTAEDQRAIAKLENEPAATVNDEVASAAEKDSAAKATETVSSVTENPIEAKPAIFKEETLLESAKDNRTSENLGLIGALADNQAAELKPNTSSPAADSLVPLEQRNEVAEALASEKEFSGQVSDLFAAYKDPNSAKDVAPQENPTAAVDGLFDEKTLDQIIKARARLGEPGSDEAAIIDTPNNDLGSKQNNDLYTSNTALIENQQVAPSENIAQQPEQAASEATQSVIEVAPEPVIEPKKELNPTAPQIERIEPKPEPVSIAKTTPQPAVAPTLPLSAQSKDPADDPESLRERMEKLSTDELVKSLGDESRYAREEAAKILQTRGQAPVKPLMKSLNSSSIRVRYWSAFILGQLRSDESVPALGRALNDPAGLVASTAEEALRKINSSSARSELKKRGRKAPTDGWKLSE